VPAPARLPGFPLIIFKWVGNGFRPRMTEALLPSNLQHFFAMNEDQGPSRIPIPSGTKLRVWLGAFDMEDASWEK
jgi:hypothetical protein